MHPVNIIPNPIIPNPYATREVNSPHHLPDQELPTKNDDDNGAPDDSRPHDMVGVTIQAKRRPTIHKRGSDITLDTHLRRHDGRDSLNGSFINDESVAVDSPADMLALKIQVAELQTELQAQQVRVSKYQALLSQVHGEYMAIQQENKEIKQSYKLLMKGSDCLKDQLDLVKRENTELKKVMKTMFSANRNSECMSIGSDELNDSLRSGGVNSLGSRLSSCGKPGVGVPNEAHGDSNDNGLHKHIISINEKSNPRGKPGDVLVIGNSTSGVLDVEFQTNRTGAVRKSLSTATLRAELDIDRNLTKSVLCNEDAAANSYRPKTILRKTASERQDSNSTAVANNRSNQKRDRSDSDASFWKTHRIAANIPPSEDERENNDDIDIDEDDDSFSLNEDDAKELECKLREMSQPSKRGGAVGGEFVPAQIKPAGTFSSFVRNLSANLSTSINALSNSKTSTDVSGVLDSTIEELGKNCLSEIVESVQSSSQMSIRKLSGGEEMKLLREFGDASEM
ncbi:hypothetical protein ACHAXS_003315 [Conticribra weissflogii]